jgi:hypothetical protein
MEIPVGSLLDFCAPELNRQSSVVAEGRELCGLKSGAGSFESWW